MRKKIYLMTIENFERGLMIKFTETHEWIIVEDKIATVGITDHAQKELGEVVYVELPTIGYSLHAGDEAVVVESTKAAVDIYSPLSGEITAINTSLLEAPQKVNESAESEGWLFKLRLSNPQELDSLLDKSPF